MRVRPSKPSSKSAAKPQKRVVDRDDENGLVWEWDGEIHTNCLTFCKVKEDFGGLSNMSNEFPLEVNGERIGSSEALYQACRFPHQPDWQRDILDAPGGMQAKMEAKRAGRRKDHSRTDWEDIHLDVMYWCLQVKLAQHPRFGTLLRWSGHRPIVEESHRDRYWGAVFENDGVFRGQNMLGRLLMNLRDELAKRKANGEEDSLLRVAPLSVLNFRLLGKEIGEVVGKATPVCS